MTTKLKDKAHIKEELFKNENAKITNTKKKTRFKKTFVANVFSNSGSNESIK